jgi:hypothetical protein
VRIEKEKDKWDKQNSEKGKPKQNKKKEESTHAHALLLGAEETKK